MSSLSFDTVKEVEFDGSVLAVSDDDIKWVLSVDQSTIFLYSLKDSGWTFSYNLSPTIDCPLIDRDEHRIQVLKG